MIVREVLLDPSRLDAAVRAHGSGRSLERLIAPTAAELDTPHDIAQQLQLTAGTALTRSS